MELERLTKYLDIWFNNYLHQKEGTAKDLALYLLNLGYHRDNPSAGQIGNQTWPPPGAM